MIIYRNVFLLLFGITFLSLTICEARGDGFVFSPNESPYGLPYYKWTERWWQWAADLTKSVDLVNHYTEGKCSVGQNLSGNVWFLATDPPTTKEWTRSCTIPKEMAILFPAASGEEQTISAAKEGNEGAQISVNLDGQRLNYDSVKNRTTSVALFNITWPENNIFGVNPGTVPGAVDGYFIFLKPLTPGKHVISYLADIVPPSNPVIGGIHQKGTYILTIK